MKDEKKPPKPPPIFVAVDEQGNLTLNGKHVSESELMKRIAQKQTAKPNPETE